MKFRIFPNLSIPVFWNLAAVNFLSFCIPVYHKYVLFVHKLSHLSALTLIKRKRLRQSAELLLQGSMFLMHVFLVGLYFGLPIYLILNYQIWSCWICQNVLNCFFVELGEIIFRTCCRVSGLIQRMKGSFSVMRFFPIFLIGTYCAKAFPLPWRRWRIMRSSTGTRFW